ncbi:MAG: FHA domain-containing protein [Clostridium sp.]|nr:FHA domain-containing protein [Clostridium sp.]
MYITVIDGDRAPYQVDLLAFGKNKISFGRGPNCDIVLHAEYASREHGYFIISGNKCIIEDCGSTNGLIYNEKRVEKKGLNDSARIYIKGKHRHPECEVSFIYSQSAPNHADQPLKQEQPVRVVEREKIVEKKIFSPTGKAALVALAVVMVITLITAVIMPNVRKKLKGEYVFEYEYEDGDKEIYTVILDDGTWTVCGKETALDSEPMRKAGTYTVENNLIFMKSVAGNCYVFLFDSKYNQIAQGDYIYECKNKKTKAELVLDDDYIKELNSKAEKAAQKAAEYVGYDTVEEEFYYDNLIHLDDLNKPYTSFEKQFAKEINYENDKKLQTLLEEGMICFSFDIYADEVSVYVGDTAWVE